MTVLPVLEGDSRIRTEASERLRDESNLRIREGRGAPAVERIYEPTSPAEVAEIVREACAAGIPLTVSGARTGISGGAVPVHGGWVLSTSRLLGCEIHLDNALDRNAYVVVKAGITLDWLRSSLAALQPDAYGVRWHYPVDPTEWSASVGGTLATNASGGRSFHYGPTARWVRAVHVVFPDGSLCWIRRGEVRAGADGILRWPEGPVGGVPLPRLQRPEAKCVAGYDAGPHGDLVDLLIGSEGTLGVLVGAELDLAPEPSRVFSLVLFLGIEVNALSLVARVRTDRALTPLAMEYLDLGSLDLLRAERTEGGAGRIPAFPDDAGSALLFEFAFESEEAVSEGLEAFEAHVHAVGASLESSWAGEEAVDRRRMRALRHAVPEAVNTRIARNRASVPGIHKVGTDLAVPDRSAEAMAEAYRRVRERCGVPSVLFGHAAENHLHLNFLPETLDALETARAEHMELARIAVSLGGSVTAEHGIGRLKRALVPIQYGPEGERELARVKAALDPKGILNPGVLIP